LEQEVLVEQLPLQALLVIILYFQLLQVMVVVVALVKAVVQPPVRVALVAVRL
jgi:hypothetical protein